MRPETKERADTNVGSVLRGSFTFYQATAGDMEGWEKWKETHTHTERVAEKMFSVCKHLSEAEMISLIELSLRWVEPR